MGRIYNNKKLSSLRRILRNNKTQAEEYLWYELRKRQVCRKKFRRQFSVGNYILDFYCPEIGLGIELDGEGHSEERQKRYDEERTNVLKKFHIQVLRFKNTDVIFDRDKVVREIENYIRNI